MTEPITAGDAILFDQIRQENNKGIDSYFIFNERVKSGKLEMSAEGIMLLHEGDRSNEDKRRDRNYILKNIGYMVEQVAKKKLESSILMKYVRSYCK